MTAAAPLGPPIGQLQEGIYLARGKPPPLAWRVLLLDVVPGTVPAEAGAAVAATMAMLKDLQGGVVRDLRPRPGEAPTEIATDSFAALLCYGASFFDAQRHDPPLTALPRPHQLTALRRDGDAFPALPWHGGSAPDPAAGEADLMLQLTASSENAAARAAVEIWKLIEDKRLPLAPTGTYSGFQRDDGRSWIGFHDGVTNIQPSQRLAAVECPGDPEWNGGGTYLAFLRVAIDLPEWRAIGREEQEAIVGRDKLSGCPLAAVERTAAGLRPRPAAARPPNADADWHERDAYFNPPETTDPLVEASHIHRASQTRAAGGTPAGERIFRQGYEYLEEIGTAGPSLGLNFVSFQRDLGRLRQILGLGGWLGDVNFGGPSDPLAGDPPSPSLLTLRAGGFYAVPPRCLPFPGANLFSSQSGATKQSFS